MLSCPMILEPSTALGRGNTYNYLVSSIMNVKLLAPLLGGVLLNRYIASYRFGFV